MLDTGDVALVFVGFTLGRGGVGLACEPKVLNADDVGCGCRGVGVAV